MIKRSDPHVAQLRFLYGFVVMLFVAYAAVLQQQTNTIRDTQHLYQVRSYERCLVRNINSVAFNKLFTELAEVERTNPYTAGGIGPRRIKAYNEARFSIDDCGEAP